MIFPRSGMIRSVPTQQGGILNPRLMRSTTPGLGHGKKITVDSYIAQKPTALLVV